MANYSFTQKGADPYQRNTNNSDFLSSLASGVKSGMSMLNPAYSVAAPLAHYAAGRIGGGASAPTTQPQSQLSPYLQASMKPGLLYTPNTQTPQPASAPASQPATAAHSYGMMSGPTSTPAPAAPDYTGALSRLNASNPQGLLGVEQGMSPEDRRSIEQTLHPGQVVPQWQPGQVAGQPAVAPRAQDISAPNAIAQYQGAAQSVMPGAATGVGKDISDLSAQIANIRQQAAAGQQTYGTSGMLSPVAQGLSAVTAQTEAAQEAALQSRINNELTASQQSLGALGGVAQLGQPIIAPYSSQVLQRGAGGGYEATGGAGAQSQIEDLSTKLATGVMAPNDIPSYITNSPLYAQLIQRTREKNPNFTPTVAQGAQTGAGAASQQLFQLGAAKEQAQAIAQPMFALAQAKGLNQDLPFANAIEQGLSQKLLGNADYTQMKNYLNTIRSTYANALQSQGFTPTEATSVSLSAIPDTMPLSQMQQVIQGLDTDLAARIRGTGRAVAGTAGGATSGFGGATGSDSWTNWGKK